MKMSLQSFNKVEAVQMDGAKDGLARTKSCVNAAKEAQLERCTFLAAAPYLRRVSYLSSTHHAITFAMHNVTVGSNLWVFYQNHPAISDELI